MDFPTLAQADLKGKRVLLRAGFDVPLKERRVADTARLEAIVSTVKHILKAGASVVIIAHQGRPKGERVLEMSQLPLVEPLSKLLGTEVQFADDCTSQSTITRAKALESGEVLLLENLRFELAEKSKDSSTRDEFGQALAGLADVYVNDAFPNCHRDHASMTSVPKYLPSFMGLQLEQEIMNLNKVLDDPRRPICLIVSGAKMETKVPVIEQFLSRGDDILVGGCIANTFVAARGFDVGASRYEPEETTKAQEIMLASEDEQAAMVHIPRDAVVASEPSVSADRLDLPLEDIEGDMMILDLGTVSIGQYAEIIERSGTIVWNGPLGFYEVEQFAHGTKRIAEAVAKATANGATTIIGGGDTLDFHSRYNYPLAAYTFVSTGGGAMLDYISGKTLPALAALQKS